MLDDDKNLAARSIYNRKALFAKDRGKVRNLSMYFNGFFSYFSLFLKC